MKPIVQKLPDGTYQIISVAEQEVQLKESEKRVKVVLPENVENLAELLADPKWRINNLYWIVDRDGNRIRFELNSAQEELDNDPHPRKVIPKSRQRGVTTYYCIKKLDSALFTANYSGDLIFDTEMLAKKNFKNKIIYAWDSLPEEIRGSYIVHEQNKTTLTISLKDDLKEKRSINVAVSTRGTTSQDLHISELGKIGDKFPDREEEIRSGAIESVAFNSKISVESTAMGKRGLFWNLVQQGIDNQPKESLSPLDWKLFFFPWWEEKLYQDPNLIEIPKHLLDYFIEIEATFGVRLSQAQKNWYVRKEKTLGWTMKREYPTHLLEAFEGQTEGSVYLNELGKMVADKRYSDFQVSDNVPVYVLYDFGWSDLFCLTFVQPGIGEYGGEFRIIDYYENNRQKYSHYAKYIQEKPYHYGGHILPHDGGNHNLVNGLTVKDNLEKLGLRNIHIVERPPSLSLSIQATRNIFELLRIHRTNAELLYDRLNNYRFAWDDKNNEYSKDPIHDINSHGADTVRLLAHALPLIKTTFPVQRPRRRDPGGINW